MDLFEGGIILWPINWCILHKFYCKGLLISGEVLFFFRGGGGGWGGGGFWWNFIGM